ncbi:hypothetical protein ACTXT7_017124 [Hymenolepis weldensis]
MFHSIPVIPTQFDAEIAEIYLPFFSLLQPLWTKAIVFQPFHTNQGDFLTKLRNMKPEERVHRLNKMLIAFPRCLVIVMEFGPEPHRRKLARVCITSNHSQMSTWRLLQTTKYSVRRNTRERVIHFDSDYNMGAKLFNRHLITVGKQVETAVAQLNRVLSLPQPTSPVVRTRFTAEIPESHIPVYELNVLYSDTKLIWSDTLGKVDPMCNAQPRADFEGPLWTFDSAPWTSCDSSERYIPICSDAQTK